MLLIRISYGINNKVGHRARKTTQGWTPRPCTRSEVPQFTAENETSALESWGKLRGLLRAQPAIPTADRAMESTGMLRYAQPEKSVPTPFFLDHKILCPGMVHH